MADKYPWEDWSEEKKAKIREAIKLADGIKLYRSAGGLGVGAKYRPAAEALKQRGGLSEDEALTLARFKMNEEVTGGYDGFQGPKNINTGPRELEDTPEDKDRRAAEFLGGDAKKRKQIFDEQSARNERGRERFYDDLTGPEWSNAEVLRRSAEAPIRKQASKKRG